ncbi:2OG-Fe(II) oxygenase [Henriciella sp. AS95]|uniref:2OG-Fe(II) oxygenase n=1 Tax=Henriciella sp. AS95 TaxID=3135782 RepID=UPI00316E4CD2
MTTAEAQTEIERLESLFAQNDLEAGLQLSSVLAENNQPERSFEVIVATAKAGHPQAAVEMGFRLVSGLDAPIDPENGFKWVQMAARAGYLPAMRALAMLRISGVGCERAPRRALALLTDAARAGDVHAATQINLLLQSGIRNDEALEAFLSPGQAQTRSESPRIVTLEDCLPAPMCQWWIEIARTRLQRATVWDAEQGGTRPDDVRTNMNAGLRFTHTDFVTQACMVRIAGAAGHPFAHHEPPNVLRYQPGEEYSSHYDFFDPQNPAFADAIKVHGQRVATALVYLNDAFEGGETGFDRLDQAIRMPAGGMLAFDSVSNGQPDERTLHSGRTPTSGEKWLLSIWFRDRPQLAL